MQFSRVELASQVPRLAPLSTVVQRVRRGLGVTLLPAISIEVELRGLSEVALKRLASPSPGRTIGLA